MQQQSIGYRKVKKLIGCLDALQEARDPWKHEETDKTQVLTHDTHSSLIRSELRTGEGGMDLKEISSEKKAILIKS